MILPTASALDRARTCPGSAVLPRVAEITPGLAAGTARHAYLERVAQVGREQALAEIDDAGARTVCEAIDLEGLPLTGTAPEVTFAWNATTGEARELGRGLGRDYSAATADEIVGTADVVALVGDAVFVADWKSEYDQHVPPLERNSQLRFLALAAARAYGRERVILEIIRPRDEHAWRERAELDMWGLAEVAEELRELVRGIRRQALDAPMLVVGDHCRRCPSLRAPCPAATAVAVEFAATGALGRIEDALTPLTVARTLGRVKAARAALDKIEAACEAIAWQTPIPLGDGKILGPVQRRYESYVGKELWHVLEQRYGKEVAWSAVELRAPKSKLTDVLRPIAQKSGAKITHLEREVTAELAARDGLKVKVQEELRVHRPREPR